MHVTRTRKRNNKKLPNAAGILARRSVQSPVIKVENQPCAATLFGLLNFAWYALNDSMLIAERVIKKFDLACELEDKERLYAI